MPVGPEGEPDEGVAEKWWEDFYLILRAKLLSVVGAVERRLKREKFLVGFLAIFLNPYYLIRFGLMNAIRELSGQISGRVLDFGCGSKPYEELFESAAEYIGLDTLSSGHNHANSDIDILYDGEIIPLPDRSMDSVVSFEVLEHLFNPKKALGEIARVLKPGGNLLITTPFSWEETEPPYDFARYTVYGLRALLEEAGFVILAHRRANNSFLASRQIMIALRFRSIQRLRLPILRWLCQLILIAPATIWAIAINNFVRDDSSLYSSQIVLAQKISR